ncbi:Zn(2)Cys(6) transcription factor [Fusarium albosuccineum]|uniref:Zn(2)Cys(6) transcription factor n=1 Tax=Fusarium albosuccineum TaxID=1237068 RepID=A0A8H4PGT7_9HYPO|nr:Zn(2)Cys(6) transcription factor [Fusarium albosuccineum]
MPPSKDQGGIPPSFDRDTEVTNRDTTGTVIEDTPGPVSFLDNLDISMFDVSSVDFSEVLDAPWLSEHASMEDIVLEADNFPWSGDILVSETHQPDLHVEDGPFQEELSSLGLAIPFSAEGEFAALQVPGPGTMGLDPASGVPLFPNQSSLGESQPRFNQHEALGGPGLVLDQQLGLQLSGEYMRPRFTKYQGHVESLTILCPTKAAKMPGPRTDFREPQQHSIHSGPLLFQEPCGNTYNAHGTTATINSGSLVQTSDVLEPDPSATDPYWPPMFPQQRSLVPLKRGGRHGRLTENQLKRQRTARLTGVCIRCKFLNKSCHGGFPCEACQTMRKPRLFRGPCTKAQFLEIIQAGSFFLRTSLYESMILEYLDEEKALEMRTQFAFLRVHCETLTVYALGKEWKVSYALGGKLLQHIFFASPRGAFQKPGKSNIANPWRFLVTDELHGDCIVFPYGFKGSQRVYWTKAPSRTILKEYVDRRKRVRTALWIYASIVISKIQSWTNFWENLPWSVDIFREPKVLERFADGLDNFDVEGYKASKSVLDSKEDVLQRLSISNGLHPHEQHTENQNFVENVWTRILTNTPEGVEQLRYVLSDTSGGSTDRITQYELDEAERFFLPKTNQDQKLAVKQLFGMLVSLREVQIERDDISKRVEFLWLIFVIHGLQLRMDRESMNTPLQSARAQSGRPPLSTTLSTAFIFPSLASIVICIHGNASKAQSAGRNSPTSLEMVFFSLKA